MNIIKVAASIKALHGDDRAQKSKHESFVTWLLRKRAQELDGKTIIKQEQDK